MEKAFWNLLMSQPETKQETYGLEKLLTPRYHLQA